MFTKKKWARLLCNVYGDSKRDYTDWHGSVLNSTHLAFQRATTRGKVRYSPVLG